MSLGDLEAVESLKTRILGHQECPTSMVDYPFHEQCEGHHTRSPLCWIAEGNCKGNEKRFWDMMRDEFDMDPNYTGGKRNPLICAIKHGDLDIIKMILDDEEVNPNEVGEEMLDKSALSYSIEWEDSSLLKMLLAHPKIKVNQVSTDDVCWDMSGSHVSALYKAVKRQDVEKEWPVGALHSNLRE